MWPAAWGASDAGARQPVHTVYGGAHLFTADAVQKLGALAQRLARRLCPNCKTPSDLPRKAFLDAGFDEAELDGTWVSYRAVGCSMCNNGYKGRVGLYQVMPITEAIQGALHPEEDVRDPRAGDGVAP